MLQLSLSGVFYQQQETPQALRRAIQLIQDRLQELEDLPARPEPMPSRREARHSVDDIPGSRPAQDDASQNGHRGVVPFPGKQDKPAPVQTEAVAAAPRASQNTRKAEPAGRWFEERWPKITLRTGEVVIPRSAEDLRALLERQGLRPHKRGDASMLLWQVKERLRLSVEPVSKPTE